MQACIDRRNFKDRNSNLCTLTGCGGFFVRRRHAPARVQFIITKEISRREIDGVSKKVQ